MHNYAHRFAFSQTDFQRKGLGISLKVEKGGPVEERTSCGFGLCRYMLNRRARAEALRLMEGFTDG